MEDDYTKEEAANYFMITLSKLILK